MMSIHEKTIQMPGENHQSETLSLIHI